MDTPNNMTPLTMPTRSHCERNERLYRNLKITMFVLAIIAIVIVALQWSKSVDMISFGKSNVGIITGSLAGAVLLFSAGAFLIKGARYDRAKTRAMQATMITVNRVRGDQVVKLKRIVDNIKKMELLFHLTAALSISISDNKCVHLNEFSQKVQRLIGMCTIEDPDSSEESQMAILLIPFSLWTSNNLNNVKPENWDNLLNFVKKQCEGWFDNNESLLSAHSTYFADSNQTALERSADSISTIYNQVLEKIKTLSNNPDYQRLRLNQDIDDSYETINALFAEYSIKKCIEELLGIDAQRSQKNGRNIFSAPDLRTLKSLFEDAFPPV